MKTNHLFLLPLFSSAPLFGMMRTYQRHTINRTQNLKSLAKHEKQEINAALASCFDLDDIMLVLKKDHQAPNLSKFNGRCFIGFQATQKVVTHIKKIEQKINRKIDIETINTLHNNTIQIKNEYDDNMYPTQTDRVGKTLNTAIQYFARAIKAKKKSKRLLYVFYAQKTLRSIAQ